MEGLSSVQHSTASLCGDLPSMGCSEPPARAKESDASPSIWSPAPPPADVLGVGPGGLLHGHSSSLGESTGPEWASGESGSQASPGSAPQPQAGPKRGFSQGQHGHVSNGQTAARHMERPWPWVPGSEFFFFLRLKHWVSDYQRPCTGPSNV